MLKNVITIVLSLCLIFIISVMTVNAAGETQRGVPQNRMPSMDENPSGNFALSEEFTPQEGEFTLPESEENNSSETAAPKTATGVTEENQNAPENNKASGRTQNSPFSGGMPEGMGGFPGNTQSGQNTEAQQPTGFPGFVKTYSTPITSVILLGLAFIFVIFYRKKNY